MTLSGRAFARSTGWNILGQLLPALAGLALLPRIVHGFGPDRFGLLALAFALIGYFSLFDFGLGRAMTRLVAIANAASRPAAIATAVVTGVSLITTLGLLGAAIMVVASGVISRSLIGLPSELLAEGERSLFVVALGLPAVVLAAALRGVLEGLRRFDLSNAGRIPAGVLSFGIPAVLVGLTSDTTTTCVALVILRYALVVFYASQVSSLLPGLRQDARLSKQVAQSLIRFGSWMTVSNLISPLMVQLDRFVIAAVFSVAAVTYYVVPFDAVTRLLVIAAAVSTVLFPSFSATQRDDRRGHALLLGLGAGTVFLAVYPCAFVLAMWAPELLNAWVGAEFSTLSTDTARWLLFGVLMNALAQMPFSLLQGVGRSDLTAKLHLLEAPIFVVLLIAMTRQYGPVGAATVWTLRTSADMCALFVMAFRETRGRFNDWVAAGVLAAPFLAGFGLIALDLPITIRVLATLLVLSLFVAAASIAWLAIRDKVTVSYRRLGHDTAT